MNENSDKECDYDLKTPTPQTPQVPAYEGKENIESRGHCFENELFS